MLPLGPSALPNLGECSEGPTEELCLAWETVLYQCLPTVSFEMCAGGQIYLASSCSGAWLLERTSHLSVRQNNMEDLWKHRVLSPTARVSESALGQGLRIFVWNKVRDGAEAAHLGTHRENPDQRATAPRPAVLDEHITHQSPPGCLALQLPPGLDSTVSLPWILELSKSARLSSAGPLSPVQCFLHGFTYYLPWQRPSLHGSVVLTLGAALGT